MRSVNVAGEGHHRDEEALLDHRDGDHVVRVLVPELARAHAHSLPVVLPANSLHHVLVTLVLLQVLQRMLAAVGQVLRQTRQIVGTRCARSQLVINQLLDHRLRLLPQGVNSLSYLPRV